MPPPRLVGRLRTPPAISAGAPLAGRSGTDSSGKVEHSTANSFSRTCVPAVRPLTAPARRQLGPPHSGWCKKSGPQRPRRKLSASSHVAPSTS